MDIHFSIQLFQTYNMDLGTSDNNAVRSAIRERLLTAQPQPVTDVSTTIINPISNAEAYPASAESVIGQIDFEKIDKLYHRVRHGNGAAFNELKALADQQHNHMAESYLVRIYWRGGVVEANSFIANEYAKRSAGWLLNAILEDNENKYILTSLAYYYLYGFGGLPKDHKTGILFLEGAALFHQFPHACFYLGNAHLNGKFGLERNGIKGTQLLQFAAMENDSAAQRLLGRCYWRGEGVTQSTNEATRWYRTAADQGLSYGQYGLGFLYREEVQCPCFRPYWHAAAGQGLAEAGTALHPCYNPALPCCNCFYSCWGLCYIQTHDVESYERD